MKWVSQSIAVTLTIWFIVLSTIPLTIVSWNAYSNAVQSIQAMERNKLENTAYVNVRMITDWFNEMERDLNNWSGRPGVQEYLADLRKSWELSGLSLKEYVKSDEYVRYMPHKRHYFELIKKDYDFVDDLFLIDLNGNILLNITKKKDLGTNLLQGEYANTLFAQAFRNTKEDGKTHFSDLERYAASDKAVTGFITIPIMSLSGEMTGILAVQINLKSMFRQFELSNRESSGVQHYLIGSEGLLRTQISSPDEVLSRRISTEQFWRWYEEHSYFGTRKGKNHTEDSFEYTGPDGEKVLGKHYPITIFGVKWVHISEMKVSVMNQPIIVLAQKTFFMLVINLVFVFVFSLWIARRISRPILQLKELSDSYANGERDLQFPPAKNDEIGKLTKAFELMIETQKNNEEQLQHHANEAHRALEMLKEQKLALDAHAIVATTDVTGTITYVNDNLIQISGYSREELIGSNHRIMKSDIHSREFWKEMYDTISNGGIWHGEICNRSKDGTNYWLDTTVVPFMGDDGKPESYIAIRTDITERIRNTDALTNALALQNAIFDSAEVSIIITDEKGLITQLNRSAEEMLGYKASEMVNKLTPECIHKASEVAERAKEFGEELKIDLQPGFDVFVIRAHFNLPNAYEWTYIRKDGSEFPVLLTVSALRDANGNIYGYMGLATDITVLKEAEKHMLDAKLAAEDSARVKSEFLAAMSHEIRTPLNGVIGILGLLSKNSLNDMQRHQVYVAQSSANSLLGLINDILDFSKVEAGKMTLEAMSVNLHEELGDFAEAIAFKAHEKGVDLLLDITELPCYSVISDSGRIRQILTNLVGNAIKFTHSGQISIKATLEIIEMPTARLVFDISDTGIGIPEEKLDHLFDAFTQADSSTTRKYGGTGLGLAIVKKLCELMGGSIRVQSALGEGTTFSAEIQVKLEKAFVINAPHLKEKHFLIIDHNDSACRIFEKTFTKFGARVDKALSYESAMRQCIAKASSDEAPYDMILIDQELKDADYRGMADEIHKLSRFENTKIVLMTPIGSDVSYSQLKSKGFIGYFAKPYIDKDGQYLDQLLSDTPDAVEKFVEAEQSEGYEWPAETRLLLVEDNLTNQIVAEGMLNHMGLKPEIANNGVEALEKMKRSVEEKQPYTVILMDCQMPEMDGYETTGHIRLGTAGETYRKIPIIALTANAMSGDREQCISAGMDDYLSKPINPEHLEKMLMKWVKGIENVSVEPVFTAVPNHDEGIAWDQAEAIQRLGGKKEFLARIIDSCREDTPRLITLIEDAIAHSDFKGIQLHSHSIKGSAGNVSANRLQAIAKAIEAASKEENLSEVNRLFPHLKDALSEVIVLWDKYLSQSSQPEAVQEKKKVDTLQLAIELQGLKAKIVRGDYIETPSLPIFQVEYESPIGSLMKKLKESIDHSTNDESVILIDTIMYELE